MVAETLRPWPLFEVAVDGFPPHTIAARTRSAASYQSFLSFTDAYDCKFRDWLRMTTVRKVAASPVDAYAYVRRNYNRDLRHGTRVTIAGEGRDLEGQPGTVIHPGRESTCYAHVVMDGAKHAIIVHPLSVVMTSQPQEATDHAR